MTAVEWRGRLDEQPDDLPIDEAIPLRREARALLGNLLRPYRMTLGLLAVVVIVENIARLSVPLLVQRGIDHALPPLLVAAPCAAPPCPCCVSARPAVPSGHFSNRLCKVCYNKNKK